MEHPTVQDWLTRSKTQESIQHQTKSHPNYGAADPSSLIDESNIHSVVLGTGDSIYKSILPTIEAAEHEIILGTCFWARSSTLQRLNDSLLRLSAKGLTNGKVRVRICFSSSSITQKLFHTSSRDGHVYPSSTWVKSLGLSNPEDLQGLDLEIKSIFLLPFSVMHPKFIIVDRQRVFLPSCNVSWEDWYEGCVELTGPITQQFVNFWKSFWANEQDREVDGQAIFSENAGLASSDLDMTGSLNSKQLSLAGVPSVFLPSPHNRNPLFNWPGQRHTKPPATPLNLFLLALLENARRTVYMQTPNLTSPPVLEALVAALARGVNVDIVTSERLMVLEQLVTAWTTTSRCVTRLIRTYKGMQEETADGNPDRLESGRSATLGSLKIMYYVPSANTGSSLSEPVQSHLKLTVADNEVVVLGSGNMDRASWYTSQELGVAFLSREFATEIQSMVSSALVGRTKHVFRSDEVV